MTLTECLKIIISGLHIKVAHQHNIFIFLRNKNIVFKVCSTNFEPPAESPREHSTKNFQKHLTMGFKFTRTGGGGGLACYRITAFPCELKGVLHSQEDGTNIFPNQLHNMNELCAFRHEHP